MSLRAGCFTFLGIRVSRFAGPVCACAGIALMVGACGINVNSRKLPISATIAKPEFAEPAWMSVRKGTREPNRYPGVKVNFARVVPTGEPTESDPSGALGAPLQIRPGDRVWLGVSPRGMVQDPPTTGWQQVLILASAHDFFQELPVDGFILPPGKELEPNKEYVLALRITRGFEGGTGSTLLQILNVASFVLDQRRVVAAAIPLLNYGLSPDKPLAIRHRSSAFPFGASCRFSDANDDPRPVRPGDVAYVSLFGLRISEVLDLSGYSTGTPGTYRFTLPVDTSELPETGAATNVANEVMIHCETSAGTTNSTGLASGIDYTPPALSVVEGTGTLGNQSVLTSGGQLTFIGSCFGGSRMAIEVFHNFDPNSGMGSGFTKAIPAPGFDVTLISGFTNDCHSLADSTSPQKNTGLALSLSASRPPASGSYVVRVKGLDPAGNESVQFLPIVVVRDSLIVEEDL